MALVDDLIKSGATDEAILAIAAVYDHSPSGGGLHFILEDDNLEDYWFDKGYHQITDTTPEQEDVEHRLWAFLRDMTEDQRRDSIVRYEAVLNEIGVWRWL